MKNNKIFLTTYITYKKRGKKNEKERAVGFSK